MGRRGRRLLDRAAVVVVGALAGLLLDLAGVPSAPIFGGLVAGLARTLLGRGADRVPQPVGTASQALIGVSVGFLVESETLGALAEHWLPIVLVTLGTLAVSLVAGQLMRLQRGISPVTGAFSMIAGGASGITAVARDLGADEQVVAVLQYVRVLIVLIAMPIVATTVYGASGGGAAPAEDGAGWPGGLLFTALSIAAGLLLGRLAHLPVGSLLGPMAVAATLDLTGVSQGATVPLPLEWAAFLAIGLQVGLGFTRADLRLVGRALPLAVALVVGSVVACAGLGLLLSRATGVGLLDGYLATTPGGLYAVLATATGSGADATFVLAVQVLRLFVMLFSAPLLARSCARAGSGDGAGWRSGQPRRRDLGGSRAYCRGPDRSRGGVELSERAWVSDEVGDEDAVLLFVGGPLDGRVQIREARHGQPLPTITHVHLHGGPKVVHRYDLESLTAQTGVYHLRQRAN